MGLVIKTSSDPESLEKEKVYLGKLNMILVQVKVWQGWKLIHCGPVTPYGVRDRHVENFWGIVSPNDQQVQNIVIPMDILPVQKHENN